MGHTQCQSMQFINNTTLPHGMNHTQINKMFCVNSFVSSINIAVFFLFYIQFGNKKKPRHLFVALTQETIFPALVNKVNCRKVYRSSSTRKIKHSNTWKRERAYDKQKNGDCVKRHTEITFKRSEYFCNTNRLDKILALHAWITKEQR